MNRRRKERMLQQEREMELHIPKKRTVLLLFLRVCNGLAIVIKVVKAFET